MSAVDALARVLTFPGADLVADAQIAALHAAGYAVVPVEPTEAMLRAAHAALYQWRELQGDPQANPTNPQKHAVRYRAMLAAAQEPGA